MNDSLSHLSAKEKRELLERLLKQKAAKEKTPPPTNFPCSAGQRALWYAFQRDREQTAYNVFLPSRIRSRIDLGLIQKAMEQLVARHRTLRTVFGESQPDREPSQTVVEELPPEFRIIDATDWSEKELRMRVLAETQRPFDLTVGPLLRVAAFQVAADDVVIVATTHHIAVDFWSLVLIMDEVQEIYSALLAGETPDLPEPVCNYHEFVTAQRDFVQSDRGRRAAEYWERQLTGVSPLVDWVTDFERPRSFTHRAGVRRLTLTRSVSERLVAFARRMEVTENVVVMALLQALIGRFANQDTFSIGSPFSGRSQHRFENTVGFFVNMLPITADLSGNPTFETLTSTVGQRMVAALAGEGMPFSEIVRGQAPTRDPSHHPLFQVSCTFEKSHRDSERGRAGFLLGQDAVTRDYAGMQQQSFGLEHPTCLYDLEFVFEFGSDGLRGMICYCSDLFAPQTIDTLASAFVGLAERFLDDPRSPIKDIAWPANASGSTSATSTSPWRSHSDDTVPQTVVDLLADSDQPIVVSARRFATQLRDSGVSPHQIVPVCLPRGPKAWIGILGTMLCGAIPVPLDARQPSVKPETLTQDAKIHHVIATGDDSWAAAAFADASATTRGGYRIEVEEASFGHLEGTVERPAPDDLAYVIYTSGSTGVPKGVMVPHQAIAMTLQWRADNVCLSHDDRVLVLVSHGFDAALAVVLSTLHQGATPIWPHDDRSLDLDAIIDQIIEDKITVLPAVPSLLRAIVSHPRFDQCRSLRQIWSGGEAMTHELITLIRARFDGPIWNFYGPTEAAVEVIATEVSAADPRRRVPIGYPLCGTDIHLLDPSLNPVPQGMPGQIAIGGRRLALGYLNRPQQTTSAFVTVSGIAARSASDSEVGSTRVYLTGDRGRMRDDGQIEFLGRLDHQVKVRGYRIELEEIEAVLESHPAVRRAAVTVVGSGSSDQRLAGYVETGDGGAELRSLRALLDSRLPAYKRPSTLDIVPSLPIGPSGKVIRDRLPQPRQRGDGVVAARPHTDLEAFLLKQCCLALEESSLGVDDNFFEAGGTSLQAAVMTSELSDQLGVSVPASLIFDLGSVAAIANRLVELHPRVIERRFGAASVRLAPTAAGADRSDPLLADWSRDALPATHSSAFEANAPLFMVHPPGGIVICYRELAAQLQHRLPVIGVRSRGLHGDETLPESLTEMAAEYARSIIRNQPDGPLFVGGWSLGGVIAYEVAQQLHAQSRYVDGLVLIDSTVPEQSDPDHVVAGQEYGLDLSLSQLSELSPREQLPFLYDHAERLGVLEEQAPAKVVEAVIEDLRRLFAHHVELCQSYPLRPLDVPVLLLRPRETPGVTDSRPDRGWGRWVREVEVATVAGHHHSMVQVPGAIEMADRIDQFITACWTVKKS